MIKTIILFLSAVEILAALEIGEECVAEGKGVGVCRSVRDCQEVVEEMKMGIPYTVCGFTGLIPIVCCHMPEQVLPPNAEPEPVKERLSVRKCREYSSFTENCLFGGVPYIVGGRRVFAGEYPHMTAIGYDMPTGGIEFHCGGSLISPSHVLTAAHCLDTVNYGPAKLARLGDLELNSNDENSQAEEIPIQERIPHPDFHQNSHYNDIGVIVLVHPVSINNYKRPACLAEPWLEQPSVVTASGWGATDWSGDKSNELLQVELSLFSPSECKLSYEESRKLRQGINVETQLCAGSKTTSADACQGDSGGPLQIYHPEAFCIYAIVGVTSFGKVCGISGTPGVYTRVDAFLDWIESVVWNE